MNILKTLRERTQETLTQKGQKFLSIAALCSTVAANVGCALNTRGTGDELIGEARIEDPVKNTKLPRPIDLPGYINPEQTNSGENNPEENPPEPEQNGALPAYVNPLIVPFEVVREHCVFPVQGYSEADINDTRGPRIKMGSGGRYDDHPGIDIRAPEGTPVVAACSGIIKKRGRSTEGGNYLLIEHDFPEPITFRGMEHQLLEDGTIIAVPKDYTLGKFYTAYYHLQNDSIPDDIVQILEQNEETLTESDDTLIPVEAGDEIAAVGSTGTTTLDHLHIDLLLGVPYSLRWQLANPDSRYASGFMFQPNIHPGYILNHTTYTINVQVMAEDSTNGKELLFSVNGDNPWLKRIEVYNEDNELLDTQDLDTYEGFNPTSTATLDNPDREKPYFSPIRFRSDYPTWQTSITLPWSFLDSTESENLKVVFYDIHGQSTTVDVLNN